MTPMEKYNETLAASMIKKMEKRGFDVCYCPTKELAVKAALEMMPEGSTVTWGGSMSIMESGLVNALDPAKYHIIDRAAAKNADEVMEMYRQAFSADYYLMSTNAITKDGELVNTDGNGNRIAAMIFGPKNVIMMVGMNKVAPDLTSAIERIHHIAGPVNAMRLNRNTPCTASGSCADCYSPDCICSHTVITRRSGTKGRIKIILVGETLGY